MLAELINVYLVIALIFFMEMVWACFNLGLLETLNGEYALSSKIKPGSLLDNTLTFLAILIVAMLWPFYFDEMMDLTMLILWLWRW